MKYIKLPLDVELRSCGCGMYRIIDCKGEVVSVTTVKDSKRKAQEIVQACNRYDALIALAKHAEELSRLLWDKYGDDVPPEFVVSLMELDRNAVGTEQ